MDSAFLVEWPFEIDPNKSFASKTFHSSSIGEASPSPLTPTQAGWRAFSFKELRDYGCFSGKPSFTALPLTACPSACARLLRELISETPRDRPGSVPDRVTRSVKRRDFNSQSIVRS